MKNTLTILLLLMFAYVSEAQKNVQKYHIISTRLGLNSGNNFNLFVTPSKKEKPMISFGFGWRHGLIPISSCSILGLFGDDNLQILANNKGPTVRLGVDRIFKKIKIAFYIEGGSYWANNIKYREYCGAWPDYDPVDIATYDWKGKVLMLRWYIDLPLGGNGRNFYCSLAGGKQYVDKHYSEEGNTIQTFPSDRVEKYWKGAFATDVGFRFAFW